jgi:outer membrane lipoprotein-sorting protein
MKKVNGKPMRVELREMSSQGVVTMRYSDKVRNTSEVNATVFDIKVRENAEISGNKTIL